MLFEALDKPHMIIIFRAVQYLLPERLLITEPSDYVNMIVSSVLVFDCAICWTFNVECVTRYRWTLKSWSPDRVQLVSKSPIILI